MSLFPNVEAFLLVGGKSSRMGRDKALLELNGAPLIKRTADILAPLVKKTTLVVSANQPANSTNTNPYSTFELPTLADRWPNAGPLGGIATALSTAETPWCLILACDMPFLTKEWLTFLLGRIAQPESDEAQQIDAIIPETNRGLEPLCAVYRSASAQLMANKLDHGVRKVTDAIAILDLKRIGENEWRKFSPGGNLFGNLNTWQDYLNARKQMTS